MLKNLALAVSALAASHLPDSDRCFWSHVCRSAEGGRAAEGAFAAAAEADPPPDLYVQGDSFENRC